VKGERRHTGGASHIVSGYLLAFMLKPVKGYDLPSLRCKFGEEKEPLML
jgi:hypothetical protein